MWGTSCWREYTIIRIKSVCHCFSPPQSTSWSRYHCGSPTSGYSRELFSTSRGTTGFVWSVSKFGPVFGTFSCIYIPPPLGHPSSHSFCCTTKLSPLFFLSFQYRLSKQKLYNYYCRSRIIIIYFPEVLRSEHYVIIPCGRGMYVRVAWTRGANKSVLYRKAVFSLNDELLAQIVLAKREIHCRFAETASKRKT